jgi:hypothetical protein
MAAVAASLAIDGRWKLTTGSPLAKGASTPADLVVRRYRTP